MSSVEYHRLALLQYVRFQQQLEECISLEAQIAELKEAVSARHKKHRRCDKEISKTNKVNTILPSVTTAKNYTRRKLPSNFT
jgi:hypothetical protein